MYLLGQLLFFPNRRAIKKRKETKKKKALEKHNNMQKCNKHKFLEWPEKASSVSRLYIKDGHGF